MGANYQDNYIRIWRVPILLARGEEEQAGAKRYIREAEALLAATS